MQAVRIQFPAQIHAEDVQFREVPNHKGHGLSVKPHAAAFFGESTVKAQAETALQRAIQQKELSVFVGMVVTEFRACCKIPNSAKTLVMT